MITSEHTNFVFEELNRIIPSGIVSSCLSLISNPIAFKSKYHQAQHDTDQYFMHLSNAVSEETIKQLIALNKEHDPTQELKLIAAKILLGIQELSYLDGVAASNFLRIEKSEWLKYLYYNQGNLSERFK